MSGLDAMWHEADDALLRCRDLAHESFLGGGVPVGSVIAGSNGERVSEGRNPAYDPAGGTDQLQCTPVAHAEMNALAAVETGTDLASLTLWSSQRPCVLCAAACEFTGAGSVAFTRDGDANMLTGVSADGADDVWARAMPTTTGRTCGCPMSCTGTATAGDQQRRPASVGVEGPNTTVGLVHRRFHDLVVNRSKGESGQHVPGVGSASSCMPAGVGLGRRCPARWQGDRCPTIVGISPPLKADGTAGRAAEEGGLRRASWGV